MNAPIFRSAVWNRAKRVGIFSCERRCLIGQQAYEHVVSGRGYGGFLRSALLLNQFSPVRVITMVDCVYCVDERRQERFRCLLA